MIGVRVFVIGVGVWGPGLEGWQAARPILAGKQPWTDRPSPCPPPAILSATERRRTGPVVRLALTVAQEAATSSGLPPGDLRSVFASGNGDGVVVGGILDALAIAGQQPRAVSPTQFHNSVHNAAAGYWSIAHGSARPATCLGMHDDSFAAGLLKAATEAVAEDEPVLLCVYDHALPQPLNAKRPTVGAFGAGFVLSPTPLGGTRAALTVSYASQPPRQLAVVRHPHLQALTDHNPAARALPLLQALALEQAADLAWRFLDGSLLVTVAP